MIINETPDNLDCTIDKNMRINFTFTKNIKDWLTWATTELSLVGLEIVHPLKSHLSRKSANSYVPVDIEYRNANIIVIIRYSYTGKSWWLGYIWNFPIEEKMKNFLSRYSDIKAHFYSDEFDTGASLGSEFQTMNLSKTAIRFVQNVLVPSVGNLTHELGEILVKL